MAGSSVGNAYLNVVPKVDDAKAKGAGAKAGSSIAAGASEAISAKAVALGNILGGAIQNGMEKVGTELSKTFTNFMDFEQLSGGAQKIFDEIDYSKIQADASDAFRNMGMSVNEYLEAINQTGATFAQTMGDAKGYETAKAGMQAISDYASGTGKSVDELNEKYAMITRSTGSYQSIADQFSGILPATSADFLEQAQAAGLLSSEYEKLTEVPVAEYQEAVTQMLGKGVDALGLTENTAHEASETLSGSFSAASAAWDNMLTAIGDGGADIDMKKTADDLVTSLGDAISNSTERVGVIGTTLGELVAEHIPEGFKTGFTGSFDTSGFESAFETFSGIGERLGTIFTEGLGGNMETFGSALGTIGTALGTFASAIATVISVMAPFLPVVLGVLAGIKGFAIVTTIAGAFSTLGATIGGLTTIVATFGGPLATVAAALGGWPVLIAAVVGGLVALIATNEDVRNAITEAWSVVVETVSGAVSTVVTFVTTMGPQVLAGAKTAFENVRTTITSVWSSITSAVGSAVSSVVSTITGRLRTVVSVARTIFSQVKNAIMTPINAARDAVRGAIDRIKSIINGAHLSLPHFALPHFRINGGTLPWGIGGKGSPPSINVDWYARGGWVDGPTLFGAGERGGEFIWPSYAPYLDRYADALSARMGGGGVTVNLTYNGSGDADELVALLTRDLRMMRMTGAI